MNRLEIAKRLDFKYNEINKIYTKRFRGFRIDYYLQADIFYLCAKETDSGGDLLRDCSFEECSKPVKKNWLLINALVEIQKKHNKIKGYETVIQNILLSMFYEKKLNIEYDDCSGNQYSIAQKYYRYIRRLEKWF